MSSQPGRHAGKSQCMHAARGGAPGAARPATPAELVAIALSLSPESCSRESCSRESRTLPCP
jgi:hypothetical protein